MLKKAAAVGMLAVFLGGCAAEPIYSPIGHPIPAQGRSVSLEQIENAIVRAGQRRGWAMTKVAPGKIRAVQDTAKRDAIVEIEFNSETFSIQHLETKGLRERRGQIHPRYNSWVRSLEADIDRALGGTGAVNQPKVYPEGPVNR
jgi:hypothetical protein